MQWAWSDVEGILEWGVVAAAELVVVGGVLASARGEVRISDQAGPEPALVGRERGVGDVPGEGAGRAGGEVAPKGVLGGARWRVLLTRQADTPYPTGGYRVFRIFFFNKPVLLCTPK